MKDAHKKLDKDIESYTIDKEASKFKEERNSSKTLDSVIGAMRKEQEYLSGLHGKLLNDDHSQELTQAIRSAHKSASGNYIDELADIARYAHKNKILDTTQLGKYFKSNRDIMELHRDLGHVCHEHHTNIIDQHIKDLHTVGIVHHDNHKFECPIKYLQHWKNNVDHHLLPMEHIDHTLEKEHEHQNERVHTMSLGLYESYGTT